MTDDLTLEQIRRTVAEGWIYGHPMLENYRTMYAQAIDADDPRYVGGFGRFRHYRQPFTPANTDVVTPNNDTPYSWAWLDLRTEPWVVSVPATDRYYLLPFHDLDTTYVGFIGSRATGQEAGDYLIAGPGWEGEVPRGIAGVLRADTQIVGCLGRTYLGGLEDTEAMCAVQDDYRLRPLSTFIGQEVPAPAPEPHWPRWREEADHSVDFLTILDFLLGFFPVLPSQEGLRKRLAALGVDGRGTFDPDSLSPKARAAIEQGIADARQQLDHAKAKTSTSTGHFGTRDELGDDYVIRSCAADKGLYGLPAYEAWYAGWLKDSHGSAPPDAAKHDYTLRFPPGGLPPARFFWSVTIYRLPERRLVDNPIDRYAIGDRTPGLVHDSDGGLTLYIQRERPTDPDQAANWLPTPDGPFLTALRVYGARSSVLDDTWSLPDLVPHERHATAW